MWNNTLKNTSLSGLMNEAFVEKTGVTLDNFLQGSDFSNGQEAFDNILQDLNSKLTSDGLKTYPALVHVYCSLMRDVKGYKIKLNPVNIFPISLILIDDSLNENKVKGLQSFNSLVECLNEKHFKTGNYYEVLNSTLMKTMPIKDVEITGLVLQSLLNLIKVLPSDVKKSKADEIFGSMLEQLHMETNLHRKTVCVRYLKEAILVHKENCVNKKLLKVVLLENIHICCNDAVADILLVDVLECLQAWITYCWFSWQLSRDHRILSSLIKLLYVSRKETIATVIQDLIVSLVTLCTREEQIAIYINLNKSKIKSPEFVEKMEEIKTEILKLYE